MSWKGWFEVGNLKFGELWAKNRGARRVVSVNQASMIDPFCNWRTKIDPFTTRIDPSCTREKIFNKRAQYCISHPFFSLFWVIVRLFVYLNFRFIKNNVLVWCIMEVLKWYLIFAWCFVYDWVLRSLPSNRGDS